MSHSFFENFFQQIFGNFPFAMRKLEMSNKMQFLKFNLSALSYACRYLRHLFLKITSTHQSIFWGVDKIKNVIDKNRKTNCFKGITKVPIKFLIK